MLAHSSRRPKFGPSGLSPSSEKRPPAGRERTGPLRVWDQQVTDWSGGFRRRTCVSPVAWPCQMMAKGSSARVVATQLVTKWYPQTLVDPGRCVRHIRRGSKHGTELDA